MTFVVLFFEIFFDNPLVFQKFFISLHRLSQSVCGLVSLNIKDVYERYLRRSNLANSTSLRRYRQPERPRWDYYTRLFIICTRVHILRGSPYNISDVG